MMTILMMMMVTDDDGADDDGGGGITCNNYWYMVCKLVLLVIKNKRFHCLNQINQPWLSWLDIGLFHLAPKINKINK